MPTERMLAHQYSVLRHTPLVMSIPAQLADSGRIDLEFYRPKFVEAQTRIRESGLSLQSLDSLRDPERIITDGIRKHTKAEFGVVLIRTQNFEGASLNLDDCVYVNKLQHEASLKSAVRQGDLLIAIRGYLGKAAIVGPNVPTANINQHIARVAVDPKKADSGYLWAFFISPTGTVLLEQQVTGTVQQGIVLPALHELRVPLPTRAVQEYIGAKVRLAERCRERAREELQAGELSLYRCLQLPPVQRTSTLCWWVGPECHEFDSLTPRNYLPEFLAVESELSSRGAEPVGDLIRKKDGISNGATPRGATYVDDGIPFLRVQNVLKNFVDVSGAVRITT
jgi:type I restriction enzyme S subunit